MFSLNLGGNCTCRDLGKIDYWQYSKYQLIIEGKVVEIQNEEFTKKINFENKKACKGFADKQNFLTSLIQGIFLCDIHTLFS